MVKFNKSHDGMQLLSIVTLDGADRSAVYDHLCKVFNGLSLFDRDNNELLLNIPDGGCGFSLNQLREAVKPIRANVGMVIVDLDEPSQRLNCLYKIT